MSSPLAIIDSHCHLDFEDYAGELDAVIDRARAAGVIALVTIGSGRDLASARAAVALAERFPFIWATVGVHPHDVKTIEPSDWAALAALAAHPRVCGIGETGLYYHYDHSPRELQRSTTASAIRRASIWLARTAASAGPMRGSTRAAHRR